MSTLFLEEKLFGAQAEAKRNLDALVASSGEHPTEEEGSKITGRRSYLAALAELADINALVEYGEDSGRLKDKSMLALPNVKQVSPLVNILEYLEPQKLIEISLVAGFGTFHNEPAVFMLFRGEAGAMASLDNIRYSRQDVFAARHPEQDFGAERQIRNMVISPIKVGLKDLVIYSVPVFCPEPEALSLANIPARIKYCLDPFKQDGFIQWQLESVRTDIFSLFVRDGWWKINK